MNTTWSRPTKYVVGVGLVILGIYVLNLSLPVIPSLVVAALIAVIVRPVVLWLHDRVRLPRGLSVGLAYLCLAILGPLALAIILPTIIDALVYVGSLDYQSFLMGGAEWLRSTLEAIKAVQLPVSGLDAYVDRLIDQLLEEFQPTSAAAVLPSLTAAPQSLTSSLNTAIEAGASLVSSVVSQAARIGFAFLASIYISLSAHTYRSAVLNAAPAAYRPEISSLLSRIEHVWSAVLRGQLILMLMIGVITTIGLAALGVPGALYLGIIAGLLEIIPSLGPIIAAVPAVIVALVQGSLYLPVDNLAFAGLVILFYILVQQVENSLIVPRVLGAAVELPPLVVMVGVVVGASVGGILGALLATPVIASARVGLLYIHSKKQEEEPIQVGDTTIESDPLRSGNGLSLRLAELQTSIRSRSQNLRKTSQAE